MNSSAPPFIICFSSEEEKNLSELARLAGYPSAEIAVGPMAKAIKILDSLATSPSSIIIDIGTRGQDVLTDLDELALHCEPNVAVIVIGSINDIFFYRELKQRGIAEYFPRPVQANDIKNALAQAAVMQRQRADTSSRGIVVTCMSAASGDGGSTVAVNLAYCLAEEQKLPTVLLDMDYQFGLIARGLDLTAPFGIRELFDFPDRGLDDVLVEKMLVKYGENFRIIASPNELQILPSVRPEVIRDLIDILRSKFQFVIIDVPHVWTHWTAAALKYADHNILVGQLWLRSLTHTTRLLNAWQNAGIAPEKVSLIINRSGAKFKEALSAEEFERISRHKVDAHINNDIKSVVVAENQGRTIYETALEGSLLPQQFKHISVGLMERFNLHASIQSMPEIPVPKKGLKGLFDKKAGT